eukprot:2900531-Prymnesium_polylepis.1
MNIWYELSHTSRNEPGRNHVSQPNEPANTAESIFGDTKFRGGCSGRATRGPWSTAPVGVAPSAQGSRVDVHTLFIHLA